MRRSPLSRSVLPNGLAVLTETVPHARTAAVAIATRHGSRDEAADESGLSHFLEHFLFRGTRAGTGGARARTGREIAVEMDLLGGEVDAATGRESTCYTTECAAEVLPRAFDLLADLVAHPALPAKELEKERAVILEEIRGYEDSVSDRVNELAFTTFWPGHPSGRPIEGTRATLASFTRAGIAGFWRRHSVGANLIVAAAGAVSHDDVVERAAARLGHLPVGRRPRAGEPPRPARGVEVRRRAHLEQAHLLLSLPGLPAAHAELPALTLLATALGGGMSSRLWMRIREEEGLAYDVACAHSAFRDAGRIAFSIVAAPGHLRRALQVFREETADLAARPLPEEELERAWQYVRGGLVIGLESPGARASDLVAAELVFGRPFPVEEQLARLRAVTPAKVREVAARLFADERRSLVVMGPKATPALALGDVGPAT